MDNYNDWLTEMIITHGVERNHSWLDVRGGDRTMPDRALGLRHWQWRDGVTAANGWHFTQAAIDYLKERNE